MIAYWPIFVLTDDIVTLGRRDIPLPIRAAVGFIALLGGTVFLTLLVLPILYRLAYCRAEEADAIPSATQLSPVLQPAARY